MSFAKRLIQIHAIFLSGLCFNAAATAGPKIQSWHTANGAQVLFVPAPELPILDVRVVFNAGSARDAKPGIGSLTNSLLTQGAGQWDANQIAQRLENVGAQLETGSLRDMAWVALRTLTKASALNTALETFATIIGKPKFAATDLERLRNNVLVSLNQDEQAPETVGSKAVYRAIYGTHPYATDPSGTKTSVAAITQTDVTEHFRRYYVAKNAIVAIVGAIDQPQAARIADQVTAGLAAGTTVPPLPKVVESNANRLERLNFPSTQSHVYVGQIGVTRTDPDFFALYVGNHVLGGNGLVSILSKEIREQRGLSYNVYSTLLPMQEPGPFLMGLQTKNNQVEQALEVLMQTLRQFLQTGPSEQELKGAKQNITGGFPLRISSNAKIVEHLSMIGFYNLPLDYLDTFNAKVDAVTAAQVRDALARRIIPEHFVTVIVGPVNGSQKAFTSTTHTHSKP